MLPKGQASKVVSIKDHHSDYMQKDNLPCISITYCPMTFELLVMVPREGLDEDELAPVLNRALDVCCRSSMIIVSSGEAGRARGQMKLWRKVTNYDFIQLVVFSGGALSKWKRGF